MDVPISQIRHWLASCGGEVRAEGSDDELLRRLGEQLRIRGKDITQLRAVLCEMAARNQVTLEFGSDHMGSAPIVAISLVASPYAAQIEQHKGQLEEAFTANAELLTKYKAATADAEAAEELANEAVAAQEAAERLVRELQAQIEQLQSQPRQVARPAPQTRQGRSTDIASRQLVTARERARVAEARVSEVLAQLSETRRKLRLATRGYDFYSMSCGCMIARGDVSKCVYGGRKHPFYSVGLPGHTYEEGKAFLAVVIAEVHARLEGTGLAGVFINDVNPRREP